MPALDGADPEWVARTGELRYAGAYDLTNPVDPTSANFTYPMEVSVGLSPGGKNWAYYRLRSFVGIPGSQPTEQTGVTGSAGLYWIEPRALAGLTPGQILDEDPLTLERVAVVSIDPGPGGSIVTMGSELPGVGTRASYDQASGVLVGYQTFVASSGTTVQLQLQQMP